MKSERLYFIDIVRAFAILMMLQGHFIDTLLAEEFRDPNNPIYAVWSYFRGITAPTFFTISGLIFTYLLLKAKTKGNEIERIKKGFSRGLFLIIVGYLLRAPIFKWLTGKFDTYFLVIDVLQCIGLSLILIVLLYVISLKKTTFFSYLMLVLGILIFMTEPLYRDLNLENVPLFFSNYITKSNGSVFRIIPWFGYVAFGAFIATLFFKHLHKKHFKVITIVVFVVLGFTLIQYSSYFLAKLSILFNVDLFMKSASYNYLFTRFGNVLVYFAVFYSLENYLKFPLVLKIGQKTLSIYVIHFIIIYGSFTGFGLNRIIGKNLNPTEVTIGAILFLITVCFISFYNVKTNTFIYQNLRKLFFKFKN
ncbi:MAG: DUF1624 domain-containing protein [Flavobacteriaceae bacterium]|nr:DUF1624 domain-containing protein [Flavobacteriaceae bacterium]